MLCIGNFIIFISEFGRQRCNESYFTTTSIDPQPAGKHIYIIYTSYFITNLQPSTARSGK